MIKRFRFAGAKKNMPPGEFPVAWPRAVAGAAEAPSCARPSRIAVCLTLGALTGPDPKHDGIGIEWFADAGHLQRFQEWLGSPAGRRLLSQADRVADRDASPVIVAEESVLRGACWLDRRWRDGGEKLKHMAIARRADGLTSAEFSNAWRSRAGHIRRPGAPQVTIPDDARGRAYIQNHPCLRAPGAGPSGAGIAGEGPAGGGPAGEGPVGGGPAGGGPAGEGIAEWAYDAVNEVYFDDAESLRIRIAWFRENLSAQSEADLIRPSWFIAVREQVLLA